MRETLHDIQVTFKTCWLNKGIEKHYSGNGCRRGDYQLGYIINQGLGLSTRNVQEVDFHITGS